MAQIPEDIFEKLEKIAVEEHRSVSSVIVQACDHWLKEKPIRDAQMIAESSPEYQAVLKKLREDLGLPPHQE